MKKILIFLLLSVVFVFANVGKITAVKGKVFVERGAAKEIPKSGFILELNDKIVTEGKSKALVLFNDKTSITVGKDSVLSVNEFVMDEAKPENTKAQFGFGKGVFRTITGKIGKINPKGFKIKTKSASIGIRGTTLDTSVKQLPDGSEQVDVAFLKGSGFIQSDATGQTFNVATNQRASMSGGGEANVQAGALEESNEMDQDSQELESEAQAQGQETVAEEEDQQQEEQQANEEENQEEQQQDEEQTNEEEQQQEENQEEQQNQEEEQQQQEENQEEQQANEEEQQQQEENQDSGQNQEEEQQQQQNNEEEQPQQEENQQGEGGDEPGQEEGGNQPGQDEGGNDQGTDGGDQPQQEEGGEQPQQNEGGNDQGAGGEAEPTESGSEPEPTESGGEPDPTSPESSDPEPSDPEPTDPEPTDPEPTNPEPSDPEPTNPEPTNPEPSDPEPINPEPSDPEPVNPEPTNPEPVTPEPSLPTEPEPSLPNLPPVTPPETPQIPTVEVEVNNSPVVSVGTINVNEDQENAKFSVAASDPDNDSLTYAISSQGSKGFATINPNTGEITYNPNLNQNGSETIKVTVSDGTNTPVELTVNFNITAINDAPTIDIVNSLTTDEDASQTLNYVISDVDSSGVTVTHSATHGTVSMEGNVLTYTPNSAFFGTDEIIVTLRDSQGEVTTQSISVTVKEVNLDISGVSPHGEVTSQLSTIAKETLCKNSTDCEHYSTYMDYGYLTKSETDLTRTGTYYAGSQTPASVIKAYIESTLSKTATYKGGFAAFVNDITKEGIITINMDFTSQKFNGNIATSDNTWNANISNGGSVHSYGFSSTNIADNGGTNTVTSGSIDGKFYGPKGHSVGGSFQLNGSSSSLNGSFGASCENGTGNGCPQ